MRWHSFCRRVASERLFGGLQFEDCVTRDGRLCLEVALGARDAGATVATYVEALSIEACVTGGAVGIGVRDRLDGDEATIACRVVVQTLGPWNRISRYRRRGKCAASRAGAGNSPRGAGVRSRGHGASRPPSRGWPLMSGP